MARAWVPPPSLPGAADALARVRAIVATLPGTSETVSHGAPTFWHRKRTFASFTDNHHHDGRLAIVCLAAPGAQAMLVDAEPDHYFVPPYVGAKGWVGVRLDRAPWPAIASLLEAAYQELAKR
ncbi:MAG TPA: MmcQ/YjbR family DNA-binding protein [Kofleriaceae bacterium]|jgi:hypothetical protein